MHSGTPDKSDSISSSNYVSTYPFQGLIDDVRIYNRALSQSEVALQAAGNISKGSGTYTLGSALNVDGNLSVYTGKLDVSASNYAVSVSGSFVAPSGTFAARSGTLTLDGTNSDAKSSKPLNLYNQINNLTVNNGLVGYWKLDDGSGSTVARDDSGNNNHGTLTNYTGVQTMTGWMAVPTHTGSFFNPSALEFDGTNDYVEVADNSSLKNFQNMSVTMWFNANTWTGAGPVLIEKDGNSGWYWQYWSGELRFYVGGANKGNVGVPLTGTWHHLVLAYDGSNTITYNEITNNEM